MLSCNFQTLPPEFFLSVFHHRYPPSASYLQCLTEAGITPTSLSDCFSSLNYMCSSRIFLSSEMASHCYRAKQEAYAANTDGGSSITIWKMKLYSTCVSGLWMKMSHCAPILQQECQTAKVRIVKTIRHSLDIIDKVNELVPDLKVLHLVRDPRAMLHSRQQWVRTTSREIMATCARLNSDVTSSQRLLASKSQTYLQLRYEDLVTMPLKYAMDVYGHIGLRVPANLAEWVKNHTSASADDSPGGTIRQNSAVHADLWRNNRLIVQLFQQAATPDCWNVIQQMHYSTI